MGTTTSATFVAQEVNPRNLPRLREERGATTDLQIFKEDAVEDVRLHWSCGFDADNLQLGPRDLLTLERDQVGTGSESEGGSRDCGAPDGKT